MCCAPDHPLAQLNRELTAEDFKSVEWILREEGSGTVAGGIGMSCISKLAIEPLREKGQLVILNTPFWSLTRPLFMLVHRQKYQGPGLRAFMNFCEA